MQFPQLESIKSKHPRLSPKLDALANYIGGELNEGRTRIVPALAAVALKQGEAETLALLMLFENAGVLTHQYELICKRSNAVLATVSSLTEVEDEFPVYCQLCDCEHGDDDVRAELVFQVAQSLLQDYRHHAVA